MPTDRRRVDLEPAVEPPPPARIAYPTRRAFAHLNLRWNPFGEPSREQRLSLVEPADPEVLRWLAPERRAVLYSASAGRGKTSRLLALEAVWGSGVVYWRAGSQAPPQEPCALLLVDDAQLVSKRVLRRAWKKAARLAVASHSDLFGLLRKAHFTVRSEKPGPADRDVLRRILERRLEWARRDPGPVPQLSKLLLDRLAGRHAGDLRALEWELYERFQELARDPAGSPDAVLEPGRTL